MIQHKEPTKESRLCFCQECRKIPVVILKGSGWVKPSETRPGYDPALRERNIKRNKDRTL